MAPGRALAAAQARECALEGEGAARQLVAVEVGVELDSARDPAEGHRPGDEGRHGHSQGNPPAAGVDRHGEQVGRHEGGAGHRQEEQGVALLGVAHLVREDGLHLLGIQDREQDIGQQHDPRTRPHPGYHRVGHEPASVPQAQFPIAETGHAGELLEARAQGPGGQGLAGPNAAQEDGQAA
jgi:hypothetical protein